MLSKSEEVKNDIDLKRKTDPEFKKLFSSIKKQIGDLSVTSKEVNNANFSIEDEKYFE